MSGKRMLNLGWSALIGILIAGCISFPAGFFFASLMADDVLESAVNEVQAVATDRGGVVRSVHVNEFLSYSITAIVREDQLGRLQALLADQPDSVTWEYVHAPSGEHDDYLRVGVDLEMTPEHHSSEWERLFVSPEIILVMSIWFFALFLPVFLLCGFIVFEPALL